MNDELAPRSLPDADAITWTDEAGEQRATRSAEDASAWEWNGRLVHEIELLRTISGSLVLVDLR